MKMDMLLVAHGPTAGLTNLCLLPITLLVHTADMQPAKTMCGVAAFSSTRRTACAGLCFLTAAWLGIAPTDLCAAQDEEGRWETGAYSFSDELGGFVITGASGNGTINDPIVITQEMNSASPVTMVIRTIKPIRPFDQSGLYASGFLHMRIEVLNNSKLPWIEFEFELQEHLHEASIFGDGLSFDQRRTESENISSVNFSEYSRDFEPYDRLLFRNGKVDYLENATFRFMISDFTPRWEFFLAQDPRIPSS